MREMLAPTSAIVGIGRDRDVALLTDGRFSGGAVGQPSVMSRPRQQWEDRSPPYARGSDRDRYPGEETESADPGSRAARKTIPLETAEEGTEGYLKRYARLVQSASTGATFEE